MPPPAPKEGVCRASGSSAVNHSRGCQTDDPMNTKHVESFFSRIQRAYIGIHHRFSLRYFDWYVVELVWREDYRRMSNVQLVGLVVADAMRNPTSRSLCGYWQRNKPEYPDLD
ncbi:hypothetical protein E1297_02120 [Roseibium sp. RKSG952]|nr:hypothetical protein [Roseibium sp. RKSG952]